MSLTAIVCAHNPRPSHLDATLASIAAQINVPADAEFILIDNASATPLRETVDLSALSNFATARIVREDTLGLTHARIRSFHEARGDILLYIDDDNILEPDYAAIVVNAFAANPKLGAVGGKSIPRYEVAPPRWFDELGISLACRDLGDAPLYADWSDGSRFYPACAPIGAGMAIRKDAYATWVAAVAGDDARTSLGRRGLDLSSGEDNDMVLTVLGEGWQVAYLPTLSLVHQIPAGRLTTAYLERYAESSNRTWVQVLDVHGIRPWPSISPWTSPLRRAKAFFVQRAWRSPENRIRWKAVCGQYDGRARLRHKS